ncbi:MAG: response regulator, partial [Gemmatimonadetes bacterium]|nr:response regulator [Gemmatimonadota bacterium]
LDLSKIEAGRLEVERIEVDAWELLEETYRLMNAPAKAKGLRLEMTSLNAIPESIRTDPTRLRQILINLIGNAIKFTESGTILLIVHFHEVPEPQSGLEGPQLEVVVVDSGIGMSDEQVARVFEPFTQADGSMTRRFGGTGLGLTISKQLAVLLGGDIVVSSRPHQGTAFRVSVSTGPVESVPRIGIEEGRARWRDRARKSSVEVASPTLGGLRILLVEDHPVNRRLAERILERAGAHVTSVDSGIAALEILRDTDSGRVSPDILVTDLHLPGLDGHSLATTVRAEGFAGAIVALSAGQATDELRGAFDAWLGKPIDRRNVVQTLAALANRSRASSTDSEAPSMPLRGRHVLVVEDTPVNQRLVQHILERAGATTALADHGQEAVEKVLAAEESGTSFDVILMDLQMPRLDGVGATRLLREKGVAVPIVALTANATAADRERCLDAGCDEFVPKPIDRRKLLAIVGRLAGRVPAPRA